MKQQITIGLTCLLLISLLLVSSCKKDEVAPIKKTDIYLSGNVKIGDKYYPAYWKNGKQTIVDDKQPGYAAQVKVGVVNADTTVYLLGILESNSNKLILWKNKVAQNVTDGTVYSYLVGMDVVGNDIYLLFLSGTTLKLWKNGSIIKDFGSVTGRWLSVNNNDIYVTYEDGGGLRLWKNNTVTTLSLDGSQSYSGANMIALSGNDVYVSGYDVITQKYTPVYWKNGTQVKLPFEKEEGFAGGIAVSNGTVYCIGNDNANNSYNVKIWKNGIATTLSTSTTYANGVTIGVSQGNVYAITEVIDDPLTNTWRTILWKDGVKVSYLDGTQNAYALSVCILEN